MHVMKRMVLAATVAVAMATFADGDEWVFSGNIERDAMLTRTATLDGGCFTSSVWSESSHTNDWGDLIRKLWSKEPSNVLTEFDSSIIPGCILFVR